MNNKQSLETVCNVSSYNIPQAMLWTRNTAFGNGPKIAIIYTTWKLNIPYEQLHSAT